MIETRGRGAVGAIGVAALAVLATAWVGLGRLPAVARPGDPRPAVTYEEAIARVDSIRAGEGPGLNPLCRSRLCLSGARAPRAIVLLHGFTNCPRQFDSLASDLARDGYNIYIPRIPRHGMADVMSVDLSRLTAEELVRCGEEAVDIARGLGDRVTVVGLSSSGVLAAWLAAHRTDVDGAVLLAPSFAPRGMPGAEARRVAGALLRAPNFFVWWDAKQKAAVPGPRQCYPRFASRALAEVYRLGFSLLDEAGRGRPPGARVVLITTARDEGVNNALARELARRWRARGASVREYEFPDSLGVRHDMIDPEQPYQRVALTYPMIERSITELEPR